MHDELTKTGYDGKFEFITVNSIAATSDISKLTKVTEFPVFQDVPGVDAWEQHDGGKDDMYVYNTEGKLTHFLPIGSGKFPTNLSQLQNYNAVRDLLIDVMKTGQ